MSRGWDAVGAVGASLLARGQRKRDLEDELALKAKYDAEQRKLDEPKLTLERMLIEERIATEKAKQASSLSTAATNEFNIRAGRNVGGQRIFGQPGEDAVFVEPIGPSQTDIYKETQRDARAAAANASRERAAAARTAAPRASKAPDYTKDLAKLAREEAAISAMSDSEIVAKHLIPPTEAPFWRQNQINAINVQRKALESAKPAGILPIGEEPAEELTEMDKQVIANGSSLFGAEPKTIKATQLVQGGPKAEANKDKSVKKTYEQAYAEGLAEAKAAKLDDATARAIAEEYAAQFK